jgi:mannose-6-phosphate isomerase-like protein (cupin superfamily)
MSTQEPQAERSRGWRTITNRHTGEQLHLRRLMHDGVMCLELRGTLPPHKDGPPLHIHYYEDEEGTVVAGTLSAEVDGRHLQIDAGGTARLPKGSTHRWWNAGDDALVFEGMARPVVDLDVYLAAAFDVINGGPANRPPLFYLAHLAWRHRKTQRVLFAPRWAQAIIVPLVVLIGTILGRYRGTQWPGCPARNAPAPFADTHDGLREARPTVSLG